MAPPFTSSFSSHVIAAIIGASSALAIVNYFKGIDHKTDGKTNKQDQIESNTKILHPTLLQSNAQISSLPFVRSPITIFEPNKDLQIAYDARTKNPIYVLERLHLQPSSNNKKSANRSNHSFHEPRLIPQHHRPRNGYYRNSGFDRGHMAAAANYSNHDDSKMKDSFSLANVSPQHPTMNRVVWSTLESMTRTLLKNVANIENSESSNKKSTFKQLFVITGPAWLPVNATHVKDGNRRDLFQYSYPGFGPPPQLIHVPSHFFKVIFTMSENSKGGEVIEDFAAFVIPNTSFDDVDSVNLQNFLVRLTDLEAVTGITFFPEVKNGEITETLDLITEQVWLQNGHVESNVFDNDEGITNSLASNVPSASSNISKNRRTRIKKKLKDLQKNGKLPIHLCLRKGSCDKVVKIRKQ